MTSDYYWSHTGEKERERGRGGEREREREREREVGQSLSSRGVPSMHDT